jgi:hypothetical protein
MGKKEEETTQNTIQFLNGMASIGFEIQFI